jgi:hypothetical protein
MDQDIQIPASLPAPVSTAMLGLPYFPDTPYHTTFYNLPASPDDRSSKTSGPATGQRIATADEQ